MATVQSLYFRAKDNGATVFRIVADPVKKRTDLVQVANANLRNGEIKVQKDTELTNDETAQINAWLDSRKQVLSDRERQDMEMLCDQLGRAAQWVKSSATAHDIDDLSERLLWGMQDLRQSLIRRKSNLLKSKDKA